MFPIVDGCGMDYMHLRHGVNCFRSCSYKGFITNLTIQRQFFPNEEDETGAAKALMRLQDTYKLDPETISKGEFPGDNNLTGQPKYYNFLLFLVPLLKPTMVTCTTKIQ